MQNRSGQRWGVLGGGILGIVLARELAKSGADVTLCEAGDELGGLASSWRVGPVAWDRHYHVTLLSDSALRGLLRELDLEREIQWKRTRTGFYSDGRLHSMSNAWEFLRYPPLGIIDKLRLGATILYASRVKNWRRLEQVPVDDWLRRLSGRNVFERIWRPLLISKLGESYRDVSAAFIWTTINRLYSARREGMKEELFGYVPGGYSRILAKLGEALAAQGVAIRLNSKVRTIRPAKRGFQVEFASGEGCDFDRVVVTTPCPVAASICQGLAESEIERLQGVRYQGIICASVVLTRPLGGFYVTNITDPGFPFTGVIEMSALVDRDQFGGHHVAYLPKYVPSDDAAFKCGDDELQEQFCAGLARMYPGMGQRDVIAFRVSRVRHVFALPTIRYSTRLPSIRTTVPGLYILNSSHIVNGTLNVNETVLLAQRELHQLI